MNEQEKLEHLGENLVKNVRDEVIDVNKRIRQGYMKSKLSQELYNKSLLLDKNQQDILNEFVIKTVDHTLHYFVWMIEQSDEIDLVYRDPNNPNNIISFKDISDGLCGELYTENGWIEKYSKYPPSMKL